jgi:hypothetical protein
MNKGTGRLAAEADGDNSSLGNDAAESQHVEGFSVQRRSLLWLPVLTASALLLGQPGELFASKREGGNNSFGREAHKDPENPRLGELAWDEFIKQSVPEAQALYQDSSPGGQDAYLFSLAHWAARLRLETIPKAKVFRFGELNPPVHFGLSYKAVPFVVIEWRLDAGAFLPPHNHPNYSVCTLGIEGEAQLRNFQLVGEAPEFSSKNVFHVRETHSQMMSAGRINMLSPTRDNIHTFQAGKAGARGIDFGTLYGKDIGFSFLELDKNPVDAEKRIYQATWKSLP